MALRRSYLTLALTLWPTALTLVLLLAVTRALSPIAAHQTTDTPYGQNTLHSDVPFRIASHPEQNVRPLGWR